MPRRTRTRPPSPWPPPEQIPRDNFRLTAEQRAELLELLPPRLAEIAALPEYQALGCRTIADVAVQACEECVQCYNTIARARQNRQVPTNPANVARAINDLMVALRPFASGAVDLETMDVIATALGLPTDDHTAHPAAVTTCLAKLKHALAVQERAVRGRRVRDEAHRDLMVLCGYIGFCLQNLYETNSASMKDTMQARFLDRLLTFAGIPHPNAFDNPKRLITLLHS